MRVKGTGEEAERLTMDYSWIRLAVVDKRISGYADVADVANLTPMTFESIKTTVIYQALQVFSLF
jgi:hypothetical protein